MVPAGATEQLVSVVVPAYNAAATLSQTLESAVVQTYRNLEILVVDDGSQDGTAGIARDFAARDARIRLLSKANGGLSSARNHGVAHARGELIALLDADDLWHPAKIERQVAALRGAGAAAALVYTWTALLDPDGRFNGRYVIARHEGDVFASLLLCNFLAPGSATLIRRGCLEAVGGFDEELREGCEDLMCCLLLAERYDFVVVPEVLTGCRQIESSMSHDLRAMRRAYDRVVTLTRGRHGDLPGRLYRWSRSKFCVWQARRYLQRRQLAAAAATLVRAFCYDPLFPLTLPFGRRLRQVLERDGPTWRGRPFLPPCAEMKGFQPFRNSWLEDRRRDYAAAVAVRPRSVVSMASTDRAA
jgi:glycosyltransferase involved in cell wall biosynthesis